MESNYNIEDGSIVLRLKYDIKIETFQSIMKYFNGDSHQGICFENGDSEEWYDNLLDKEYNKYYYSDCEAMFYLGILESSTFEGITEFKLIKDDDGRLLEMERILTIENLLDERTS